MPHVKIAGSIYFLCSTFLLGLTEAKYYLVCTKRVVLSQNRLTKFMMFELQLKLTTKLHNVDSSLLDNLTRPAIYIRLMKGHNIK